MKKWIIRKLIPTIRRLVDWKDSIRLQDVTVNGQDHINVKVVLLGNVILDQNIPNPGGVVDTKE